MPIDIVEATSRAWGAGIRPFARLQTGGNIESVAERRRRGTGRAARLGYDAAAVSRTHAEVVIDLSVPASALVSRLSNLQLERLLAVTRRLAAPFDLSGLLSEVTAAACDLLSAERASVWLLDAHAAELVLEISSDMRQLRLPVGRGLVGVCARDRQVVNVTDCYADPRFDRSVDLRSGFRTRCSLTLPLTDARDRLVGVMQVLNRTDGPFDASDTVLAEALAAQCSVALSRAQATQELIEGEKMRQALQLARVVQNSALPASLPQVTGYAMHATFLPAEQTGGDTYDLALIDGRLLLVLADATGHGIAPALLVTQMQAMLRSALRICVDLETVFRTVNDLLAETLPDGHFVTAFVGQLDPVDHVLRFLSGGQAPILLFRADGDLVESHRATSFPMGATKLAGMKPPVETRIAPGDWLVLLSDGIFEYENREGAQFGRQRVEARVRASRHLTPPAMAEALLEDLRSFADGASQEDDITMVLLRRDSPLVTALPSGHPTIVG